MYTDRIQQEHKNQTWKVQQSIKSGMYASIHAVSK